MSRAPDPYEPGDSGMESPIRYAASRAELRRDIPDYDDGPDPGRPFHAGMRLSSAAYAAAYGAYHVADLASLGLLSDASWYQAAINRGQMGYLRAAAGLTTTAVVKGAAAYGVGAFNALGSGAAAVAARTGLATRAGRWAYDWIDWAVAGRNDDVTNAFNYYARGETTKTTGMVALNGVEGTRGDANAVMGMSASVAAGRARKTDAQSRHHYEWLHLLGRSLGGQMIRANLVAGSYHANTEMIPLENAIHVAVERGDPMQVCITAFCVAGTDVANRINYKVYKNNAKVLEKNIDANRGPVSAAENVLLAEAAASAILGGWWGGLRRWIGPR